MIKQLYPEMTKLTNEELIEFKENHNELNKALLELGWLETEYASTKEYLDSLVANKAISIAKIKELNAKKLEISTKLGDKYGDKQVDLETGELK